ncbi:MAG: glycosyltransferase, partial [Candidatus Pacebacteria bacterium]|nr:glycosyltransferase [Candidatus Paceibacterota bacterium]
VPVIAAPVGGVPEMIEVGRNGDLALPGETQRISELLLEWSEHPETLRRLKSRSVEMALERFGRATMLDAYENAFCNFVGEAAGQV